MMCDSISGSAIDASATPVDLTARRAMYAAASLLIAMTGLIVLVIHSQTPGALGKIPHQWPSSSNIVRAQKRPTLLVFLHPHCPCSKATLRELERLLLKRNSLLTVVAFLRPAGSSVDWERGSLWTFAESLQGVEVRADPSGAEAQRFGAATSGHVCLYGVDGRLQFSGGITVSRGHEGDNAGRAAIEKILAVGQAETNQTPVYGCSLFSKCTVQTPSGKRFNE